MTSRREALKMFAGLVAGCARVKNRLRDRMAAHPEVPGLVTLVSRRGEVEADAIGVTSFGGTTPMRRDTIFRISSMTKPISAALAMMLVEEGKLRLDEPVDRFLPELSNRRVLKRLDGPLEETVPAARAITLRDLLTQRMGFGIATFDWSIPIMKAAEDLKLGAFGPPRPRLPPAPDEWMRRFATLPLMAQPGEKWIYNTGFEVLSVLLARASGKPLERLYRERLFEPLGMNDTGFTVANLDRFTTSYWQDGAVFDPIENSQWSRPPEFPSASAGLVSTVDDCLVFARMMLGQGKRLLSGASLKEMSTDQITAAQKAISPFFPGFWDGRGWGLGVSITGRSIGWDGGLGTSFAWNPAQDVVAVLMTQCAGPPQMMAVYVDFWNAVYR